MQCDEIDLSQMQGQLTPTVSSDSAMVFKLGFLAKEEISLQLWDSFQVVGCIETTAVLQIF